MYEPTAKYFLIGDIIKQIRAFTAYCAAGVKAGSLENPECD